MKQVIGLNLLPQVVFGLHLLPQVMDLYLPPQLMQGRTSYKHPWLMDLFLSPQLMGLYLPPQLMGLYLPPQLMGLFQKRGWLLLNGIIQ